MAYFIITHISFTFIFIRSNTYPEYTHPHTPAIPSTLGPSFNLFHTLYNITSYADLIYLLR